MKVFYEPLGGTIEDSIKGRVCFESIKHLFSYLVLIHNPFIFIEDLSIKYYCYDDRIKADRYVVVTNRFGKENYIKKYKCAQIVCFVTFG